MPLGIYISVPFCRTKCSFCNFASGVFSRALFDRYVQQVCAEIEAAERIAQELGGDLERRVDSIYLGGGTPSVLAPDQLERLFRAVRDNFDVEPCSRDHGRVRTRHHQRRDSGSAAPLRCQSREPGRAIVRGPGMFFRRPASYSHHHAGGHRAPAGQRHRQHQPRPDRRLASPDRRELAVFAWRDAGDGRPPRQRVHAGGGRGLAPRHRVAGRRQPLSRALRSRRRSHR